MKSNMGRKRVGMLGVEQFHVLLALRHLTDLYGTPPTILELSTYLGFGSRSSTAQSFMDRLVKMGYVARRQCKRRAGRQYAWTLIRMPKCCPACGVVIRARKGKA